MCLDEEYENVHFATQDATQVQAHSCALVATGDRPNDQKVPVFRDSGRDHVAIPVPPAAIMYLATTCVKERRSWSKGLWMVL